MRILQNLPKINQPKINIQPNPVVGIEPVWRVLAVCHEPYVVEPGRELLQASKCVFDLIKI